MTSMRAAWGAIVATLLLARAVPADEAAIPVVDLAEDLVPRTLDGPPPLTGHNGQAALLRLRQGGVTGVVLPLHEPRPAESGDMSQETAFLDLTRWLTESTGFRPAGCRGEGERIGTWLSLDGGAEIARDPARIALWVVRGVRIFSVVGAADNELATSWMDPAPGPVTGLTERGKDAVRRIIDAGAVVDVATASSPARDDVLAVARTKNAPVVAISSNARALADDPRNLTDAELRSVAASGGLVAASFAQSRVVRGRTATLHDLVRQIAYMVRIAGADHVALASGYEGTRPPDGLATAAQFPVLARALLGSGMSREDVERVFFRNALRVLCPLNGSTHRER